MVYDSWVHPFMRMAIGGRGDYITSIRGLNAMRKQMEHV